MPKIKPQIKTFTPPAERAHWFEVSLAYDPSESYRRDLPIPDGTAPNFGHLQGYKVRVYALSARDAHYQLSIQMEALGWTEGQNWRITMIYPEGEK